MGHPALRSIFLLVQLLCFAGMVHFGRRASRDFGWRVFKLCGNDFERRRCDTLYAVSAYAKMDLTLTIQVPLAARRRAARPRPPPAPPGTRAAPRLPARRRRRSLPPPPPRFRSP